MRHALLLVGLAACTPRDKLADTAHPPTAGPSTGLTETLATGATTGTQTTPATVTCPDGGSGPELETTTGCYRGRTEAGVEGFLGIAYAKPPVGSRRWARTVPIAPAVAPIDALAIGSPCPQSNGTVDLELQAGDGAEDCLFLNVLRPEGAQPGDDRPILFFVHGGGNVDGHGGATAMLGATFNRPPDDPPFTPDVPQVVSEQGAIVVTVNYRLAQLGWLALPGLTAESGDGSSGNQGLWDTLTALRWVNANARQLGGDPDRILLHGESAGSVDSCALLTSPEATGLFSAVMLQSGGCEHVVAGLDDAPPFVETAHAQGGRLAVELGCDDADPAAELTCLRQAPLDDVMAAMHAGWGSLDLNEESYGPVVDGVLLTEAPADRIAAGAIAPVPVVVGVNADEGTLFTTFAPVGNEANLDALLGLIALAYGWPADELRALYDPATNYGGDVEAAYTAAYGDLVFVCPTRRLADHLAPQTDVRAYWWTHENPVTAFLGAHHGVEISYAFGTGLDFGEQAVMNDLATAAWASVAAGTPSVLGVGAWPLFGSLQPTGGTWVELSTTPSVLAEGPREVTCDWMDAQPGW